MSHCASCGRYVGPYETCPYCGAHLSGRVPIRVVKISAVVLATAGLAILWFAATCSQVPLVQAGQVGGTMNMAYVRVEGYVVRGPTYYDDSGYLAFTVADETGEVRVSVYRNEVDALRVGGVVPMLGDWVSVAGTLRVREEDVAMTLNVPDHLGLVRPEAVEREIGAIAATDEFSRIRVRGQVWEVREPYGGLVLITLRDTTGLVDVAVDQNLEVLTGALLPIEPGQSVEVVGTVSLYQDTPQIVPSSVMDIVLLPETIEVAPAVSIGSLGAGDAGRMVTVGGVVRDVTFHSTGLKLNLDDGTGEVPVFLWQDTVDALADPPVLVVGAEVQITGEVSLYQDEVEIIPARSVDVVVLAAAPEDAATDTPVPIAELAAGQVGVRVIVEGMVASADSFSGGLRLTLIDGTGEVVILLWDSVYQQVLGREELVVGARVRVAGVLEDYQGSLEVVPQLPVDVLIGQ